MNWELYAWLKRGKRRIETLKLISKTNKPLTVNEIKKELKIAMAQASFTIKELNDKKLIECLNSDDKIGRLYTITKTGKNLMVKLKDD